MGAPAGGVVVGVDVGGTKVLGGVVDVDGRVLATCRRPTPAASEEATARAVVAVVDELRESFDVRAVGLGAAGLLDAERTSVVFAPNLRWRNRPLRLDVEQRLSLPVTLENDANAAAVAEHRFGAGRGVADLVLITMGTGIGCGLLLGGRLHRGRFGMAGEPGHVRVVPDGRWCGCGNRGCWEQYASGRALVRNAQELARESPILAARMLELADGVRADVDGPVVTRAAREGDPAALGVFEEVGRWFGRGLADLAAVLDPGLVLLGGGLSETGELLIRPARDALAQALVGRGHRPQLELRPAALGPSAGLVGAAALARDALEGRAA